MSGTTNGNQADGANGTNLALKQESKLLWRHSSPQSTPMFQFVESVNKEYGLSLSSYEELHRWSVQNIDKFWGGVWQFVGVRAGREASKVVDIEAPMFPRPAFFEGATLNFAENLLFPTQRVDPESTAIIAATETTRETVSWKSLRERVKQCQAGMIELGLKEGDRVAGYVANHTNALVAMLAATSLGGIWTAVSPDTGPTAVLERLRRRGHRRSDGPVGLQLHLHRCRGRRAAAVDRRHARRRRRTPRCGGGLRHAGPGDGQTPRA